MSQRKRQDSGCLSCCYIVFSNLSADRWLMNFFLLPLLFCFVKSVFHSHIPEIWRGSAVRVTFCVFMWNPSLKSFSRRLTVFQKDVLSLLPSWKMLNTGAAKNKGKILCPDRILPFLYLSSHASVGNNRTYF